MERPRQAAPPESSSRASAGGWIVFAAVGLLWLAGVVMAGTMIGQAVATRSVANLLFGTMAVAIFAGLPIAALPRTAVVLVPLALAGGAWGYRRQPLRAVSRHHSTSDVD